MSNIDTAAYLIKHKVRATGDWITIAILGALSFQADPMSRGSWGILSRVGLDKWREKRERVPGLRLNSTWTPNNFPWSHLKSSQEWEEERGWFRGAEQGDTQQRE